MLLFLPHFRTVRRHGHCRVPFNHCRWPPSEMSSIFFFFFVCVLKLGPTLIPVSFFRELFVARAQSTASLASRGKVVDVSPPVFCCPRTVCLICDVVGCSVRELLGFSLGVLSLEAFAKLHRWVIFEPSWLLVQLPFRPSEQILTHTHTQSE